MRTTINLPEDLVNEAMKAVHCKSKTILFTMALQNIILQNKLSGLKKFAGNIPLGKIDLDILRKRRKR